MLNFQNEIQQIETKLKQISFRKLCYIRETLPTFIEFMIEEEYNKRIKEQEKEQQNDRNN